MARDDSSSLQFVPDWFVTREGVDMYTMTIVMMTVVIGMMMKINFLIGTKVIKNERPRRQKLKKS